MTSARLALASLMCVAGLAACGGDDDAGADPADPSTTSTESTEASTQSASESPSPSVAPATGPRIAVRGVRANAPEGWVATPAYAVMSGAAPRDAIGTTVYVFRFPNSGQLTLDGLGEESRRSGGWKFPLKRLDDLELDGQPAFHVAGKSNPGEHVERFGAILNDDRLTVTFEFLNGEDKATRDEIIASVLATVDYREVKQ
ncbi:hypothetical protein [Nocardioides sp. CF8]|uniref:hypothetical protein n=1 Tax=Nocardioides sp. CF8 TaxID=110319 RepID=UPI0018DE1CA9|nr:hypothetical protein [Nocardioides sp. CF8]